MLRAFSSAEVGLVTSVTDVITRFQAILASSAASERMFSETGRLVNKCHSHLLLERLEILVFLNRNKSLLLPVQKQE